MLAEQIIQAHTKASWKCKDNVTTKSCVAVVEGVTLAQDCVLHSCVPRRHEGEVTASCVAAMSSATQEERTHHKLCGVECGTGYD